MTEWIGLESEKEKLDKRLIRKLEKMFDVIVIHDSLMNIDFFDKKICFLFGTAENYKEHLSKTFEIIDFNKIKKRTEKLEEIELYSSEKDSYTFEYKNFAYITIKDKNDEIVCMIDVLGNFHFCDFWHYDNKHTKTILNILKKYNNVNIDLNVYIEREFLDRLKRINTIRIKEIVVDFDKNEYIKKVKELFRNKIKEIKEFYEQQQRNKIELLKNEMNELLNRIESEKNKSFIDGLNFYKILKDKGYKIDNDYIVINKRIVVETVKDRNKIYILSDINRNLVGKFFAENIRIKISDYSKAYVEKHYHANIDSAGEICLGDLKERSLKEVIEKIEEMLKCCNLDSCFDNDAANELYDILSKRTDNGGDVWTV